MGVQPTATPNDAERQPSALHGISAGDAYTIYVPADAEYDDDHHRPDHEAPYDISLDPEDRTAVFDLALKDDSSDGGLLDWETFAGKHRYRCCGCDWSTCGCGCVAPEWWYSYSRRQRLLIKSCAVLCGACVLMAAGVGITVWFSLASCHGAFMC